MSKNKAPRTQDRNREEPWFKKRRENNRKKEKAAKLARRKNRK